MDSLHRLFELVNTARGAPPGGVVSVDAAALSALLTALSWLVPTFLAACAAAAAFAALRPGGGRARAAEREAGKEGECARLGRRLDELTRSTNERNNYVNSIFSSIEDGILVVDAEGRIVLYNPRARGLLGIGPAVFFDGTATEAEREGPVGSIMRACAEATAAKKPALLLLETPDGRELEARVSPIIDKYEGTADFGSLSVVKDVTELRKFENLRKDFIANVSHEFRTPLTLISGFVEMLKAREKLPAADRARAFEIIDIETERLKRLVSELLTLSEIENALPRQASDPIDVNRVLADMVASLVSLAERKRLKLSTDFRVEAGALRGNESWFFQATRNLLENAIKYTPEGGSIGVEARVEAGELIIAVSDTGIGIAPGELDRIFDRFYRVEKARGSAGGGSGLGLSLVKDIASIFNGEVSVESSLGKGSRFVMRLPASESTRT